MFIDCSGFRRKLGSG